MARFYAEIQGNRGMTARQGSQDSGIWGHIRGWNVGIRIEGYVDEDGTDYFRVYRTSGSNGGASDILIAIVRADRITHI